MQFSTIVQAFTMIYQLFFYLVAIFSFLFNLISIFCNCLPFILFLLIIVCFASNLIKIKKPDSDVLAQLIGQDFPIAHRSGNFDFPENSAFAIKQCVAKKCKNILLDINITQCGELVILHKSTLEKSKINEPIEALKYSSLQNFNISEHHPLGQQFTPEIIMTLPSLLRTIEGLHVTIFLLSHNNNTKFVDALSKVIEKHPSFAKSFVFCSRSPLAIYKLRKLYPDLVCGLWMEPQQQFSKRLTLMSSIYNVLIRNVIACVTGISVVFIHKDEYNASISKLWLRVGVRPIVYFVNSPNEKRYFQQVTKTQYLTDSLRSEPQIILGGKLKM